MEKLCRKTYQQYKLKVRQTLRSLKIYATDELLTDCTHKLLMVFHKYNPSRGSFNNFCFTVVKNAAMDSFKRQSKYSKNHMPIEKLTNILQAPNKGKPIEELLEPLSELNRKIVEGKIVYNYSYRELAKKFDMTTQQIMNRFHKSLELLKAHENNI